MAPPLYWSVNNGVERMNKSMSNMPNITSEEHAPASASNTLELVSFSIGEELYGAEIMAVREIRTWTGSTPLPNRMPFVRGVINFRGTMVPIIDLRARFGGGMTEPAKTSGVIVLSVENDLFGLLVDEVSDIISTAKADIKPVPDAGLLGNEFLAGIISVEEKMVGLLDLVAVAGRESQAA